MAFNSVVSEWWDFSDVLIVKYDEGFVYSPGHLVQCVGYQHRWLVTTEWTDGPIEY
ncbi:MAG: hypothetical protein KAR44_09635 [Candidatus Aegiribacteria sp.]|nr:hypothetical protein [Candidatus Aegiribacteria sp.]